MIPVRQSTAFETAIGPVLDADGVAVTGCVVGDFKIKKTSGNFAALNGSATLTHVSAGFYDLVLTTSDVDTVGLACIAIDDTTNACAPLYLQVIEEAVYDALFAASAAGYQVPIWSSAGATVNLSATTIKTATDVETDTADIQSRLPAALVNSRMDCTIDGTGMETGAVDSILNRDASASTTNSTLGAIINDWENGGRLDLIIDDILVDTGTTLDARIPAALVGGRMDANTSAIGGSTTPVTNIGVVFNTDFATNYNTTIDMWNVNVENWNTTAVPAEHTAGYPIVTIKDGTGTGEINTNAGAIALVDLVTTTTTATTTTNLTNLPAITAGWLTATGIADGAITAAKIADGAIDRATFAADTGLQTIRSGTAQAGAAGTITLDASASSTANFYKGQLIYTTGGTGAGQVGLCFSYDGTTKVATMYNNWVTAPDNTTTFAIKDFYGHGINSSLQAISDVQSIGGTSGSNVTGISSLGTAYGAGTITTNITGNITGTLSTVTDLTNLPAITSNWLTAAGLAADAVAEIADGIWDEAQSGHTSAGTFGKYLDAQVSTVGGGTAASIADAVWDEVLSGHLTAGTTGAALNAAGSAGDPWTTTLPGSYTGSQAGFKFGTLFATALNILHPYVGQDSSLELVIGDDYYAADNRNIQFTYGASPSLSGATVYLDIQTDKDEAFEGTNITSTPGSASGTTTQTVTFDLPGTTTDDFDEGWRAYRVRAVLSNAHTVTLTRGRLNMLQRGEDAP